MFYNGPSSIRSILFDRDRTGRGEPPRLEPRDRNLRSTDEQSNAPGDPRQTNDLQGDFDFDSPNGERPNDLANPSARELRREGRSTEENR